MGKAAVLFMLIAACGGDSAKDDGPVGSVDDCSQCGTDQICVIVFADERTTSCEAIPEACSPEASCFDDVCADAMYDECPEGFVNMACSHTFPPTVISCNP